MAHGSAAPASCAKAAQSPCAPAAASVTAQGGSGSGNLDSLAFSLSRVFFFPISFFQESKKSKQKETKGKNENLWEEKAPRGNKKENEKSPEREREREREREDLSLRSPRRLGSGHIYSYSEYFTEQSSDSGGMEKG